MELIVRLGEREERVRIVAGRDGYVVEVGGTRYQVDRRPIGDVGQSLVVDGAQHEVTVLERGAGCYWVGSRRGGALVEVADPLTHLARQGAAGGRRRVEQVTAYMPGRVVAVLVAEGDEVRAGQGMVVLEAMKMENEIRTEHDGVVKRIFVESGQAVEGGDPLFELA